VLEATERGLSFLSCRGVPSLGDVRSGKGIHPGLHSPGPTGGEDGLHRRCNSLACRAVHNGTAPNMTGPDPMVYYLIDISHIIGFELPLCASPFKL
jgi:hypothetical protein